MSAKKRNRKLSPANLEIMKVVWEKGDVTINDVVEAINASRKDKIRRTTVQVQMNRLEDYGWLKHTERGRTYVYSAVVEKQKTRREILDDIKNSYLLSIRDIFHKLYLPTAYQNKLYCATLYLFKKTL